MKLVAPQPNQMFINVPRSGNTYTANDDKIIEAPDHEDDRRYLLSAGCADFTDEKVESEEEKSNLYNTHDC